jgi:ankyrin repeat protein
MVDSHPLRYFFNLKLDDANELSLFHKVILLGENKMFNSLIEFFSNKFKEEININNSNNSNNSNSNSRDSNSTQKKNICLYQLEDKKTNDTEDNELNLIKLLSLKDKDGNSPMLFAAYKGNIEIISKLISLGVNYNCKNNAGLDVIQMAAQSDNANEIIYFKEKYNYDFFQKDYQGNNSIHWASSNWAKNALGILLFYIDDKDKNLINP